MATRTVTGTILSTSGTPLEGKRVAINLLSLGTSSGGPVYVEQTKTTKSDQNGEWSLDLWVNGDSEIESVYEITFHDDTRANFIIPSGIGSIDISTLIIEYSAGNFSPQLPPSFTLKADNDAGNLSVSDVTAWKLKLSIDQVDNTPDLDKPVSTATQAALGTKLPLAGGTMTGTINFVPSQTFDGRNLSVDGAKLDGIEAGATADQTGAEIKAAYEGEANAFTDALFVKLDGIEAGATADQTGPEIKTLYEGEADTNAFTNAEKTKLAGIETGATADQTGAEIKAAYEGEADTNAFTDAEKTSLASLVAKDFDSVVRVSQGSDLSGSLDSTKVYYIDGIVDMTGVEVEVPAGGLSIVGSTFDISQLVCTDLNYTMFTSPVGGSGNLVLKDIGIETSGTGSSVFGLTDATGFSAIEIKVVNFNNCTSLGYLDGYRQGLESGTGRFGGSPELEFRNSWVGGYRTETTITRSVADGTTLFKAGAGFAFNGRVILGMNADLNTTGAFCDFAPANINNDESLQISDCRVTRNGALDASDSTLYPNIDHTNVKCLWSDNAGMPNTTKYIKAKISAQLATAIVATSTYYPLAGTFTLETNSHLDMPSNGEFELLSGNGTYQIFGDVVLSGTANESIKIRVTQSTDGGVSFPTEITSINRVINNNVGGTDTGFFPINFIATIQEGDRLRIEVSNETSTNDVTALVDSFFIITGI